MNRTFSFGALAVAVVVLAGGLAGCERDPRGGNAVQEHLQAHLDPEYACPMHPDVTSDQPGRCPVCGMDLVRKEPAAVDAEAERKILHYRHPHNPGNTSPEPAKDEMGMDYVPVYADGGRGGVTVSPEVRHSLGIRTGEVERGPLPRVVDGVGFVTWDADRLRHVHTRASGWVERWNVAAVGDAVEKGQVLFELYSPEMATAEEEFIQALRMDNPRLVAASARKLEALGFPPGAIERLRQTRKAGGRIPFRAEADGIVVELAAREGMFVQPMTDVLVIADLSRVWVEADVLASRGSWLRPGLPARVTLETTPGREWRGEITWVYPEVDPVSRARRVRLAFDNPEGTLMPNAWASVSIAEPDPVPVIHVPREAVIRSGLGERVVVETQQGRYAPRAVRTGYESDGRIVIVSGLKPGETVVTSGQFLLDSEASLRGELERLGLPEDRPDHDTPETDHSGHDMSGTDHSGHDMPETDHSGHDMSGTDHSGHDMPETDHSGHDMSGTDHSGHDMPETDHTGHDMSGMDHSGHDMPETDHSGHDKTGMDDSGHDHSGDGDARP